MQVLGNNRKFNRAVELNKVWVLFLTSGYVVLVAILINDKLVFPILLE